MLLKKKYTVSGNRFFNKIQKFIYCSFPRLWSHFNQVYYEIYYNFYNITRLIQSSFITIYDIRRRHYAKVEVGNDEHGVG